MYCNRNNQLKQRKERQIKNEQLSNKNKLILIILITTKFCHVFQITLSKILNIWDLSPKVESFPITSCTKGWVWCTCTCSSASNIGWTCPRRLSHRKHVYLFIFLFSCTKIWSLLIQPGQDENAFKWADNFNTKHLHFLHKCSFRLRKKASFWSTYRAKQTTNKGFLIEGRKESHECFVSFFPLYTLRNLLDRSREKPGPVVNPWLAEGNVPRRLTQANNVTSSSDWFMGMRGHL